MKSVIVILSVYNGSEHICRQLDSILAQENVIVKILIRDDQSTDDSLDIIRSYQKDHPDVEISLIEGKNEGYAKSFWDGLNMSGDADYYAFSDQDDVWKSDKLYKCISKMENEPIDVPKLAYCKMQRSDINLERLNEQVDILRTEHLTKKISLTKTYNYGAATVINQKAKELCCRCWPEIDRLPHDLWVGSICCWFGKVYYIDEELYYWIRYDTSVTGAGTKKSGYTYRILQSINGKSYPNFTNYILEYYSDLLSDKDIHFLKNVKNYKSSLMSKWRLISDKEFRRDNWKGTLMLKLGICLNWY